MAIVRGVTAHLPSYLLGRSARILDAWGRVDTGARPEVEERLRHAVDAATQRVTAELEDLVGEDPLGQRATPLEVVRGAVREPSRVLADAGVPPVVRDEFEERSFPDDRYGLAPHTFADLDDDLGPLQLVWGLAKATVVSRARPDPPL